MDNIKEELDDYKKNVILSFFHIAKKSTRLDLTTDISTPENLENSIGYLNLTEENFYMKDGKIYMNLFEKYIIPNEDCTIRYCVISCYGHIIYAYRFGEGVGYIARKGDMLHIDINGISFSVG